MKPHSPIPFTKLQGLGNDFVLVDLRAPDQAAVDGPRLTPQVIRAIADRKRGVGFDQLLVLRSSARVHCLLDIFNADATLAEMCGNGLRAAALYLWTRGQVSDRELVFETAAGDRSARALGPLEAVGQSAAIECEMGVPRVLNVPAALKRGVRLGTKTRHPVCVNVGNPHAVVFSWPKTQVELAKWGRLLETHRAFPRRTNVEFVRLRAGERHIIEVKVWERGVGITEACGTGAVAAAVAAIRQGLADSPVEVRFPGGVAEVRWDGAGQPAFLRGHALEVFSGNWPL
ncbi:MAG: diaminopimelate epimerase [Deltaproteobacteria bacterium]|nr:diaminopimelate epimerase [Deltaproteobacteria bacterium]